MQLYYCNGVQLGVRLGLVLLVRDQARFKQKRLGTHH
jgi:hypothetical protein